MGTSSMPSKSLPNPTLRIKQSSVVIEEGGKEVLTVLFQRFSQYAPHGQQPQRRLPHQDLQQRREQNLPSISIEPELLR
jgi:hypothetical protein